MANSFSVFLFFVFCVTTVHEYRNNPFQFFSENTNQPTKQTNKQTTPAGQSSSSVSVDVLGITYQVKLNQSTTHIHIRYDDGWWMMDDGRWTMDDGR